MLLTNLDLLFSRIKDPEYAYLLLEPLPLFGLFFGLVFFALGLWGGQDKCRLVALAVIALSCASVVPYTKYRNRAMPRILTMVAAPKLVKDQTQLRKDTQWVYLAVAGVALLTLVSSGKANQMANYAMILVGIGGFVFSLWIHMKEAEVYHPNIRSTPVKPLIRRA